MLGGRRIRQVTLIRGQHGLEKIHPHCEVTKPSNCTFQSTILYSDCSPGISIVWLASAVGAGGASPAGPIPSRDGTGSDAQNSERSTGLVSGADRALSGSTSGPDPGRVNLPAGDRPA